MGVAIITGLALAGLIVGAAGLIVACLALIEVKALKQSTHSIEYVNPQSFVAEVSDKDLEKKAKREGLIPVEDDEFEDL